MAEEFPKEYDVIVVGTGEKASEQNIDPRN